MHSATIPSKAIIFIIPSMKLMLFPPKAVIFLKPYKRIIAGFFAIATLFANVITVSAEVSSKPDKVGWWAGWMHRIAMRSDGMRIQDIPVGGILANIVSDLSHGTVCEFSDDHWHHADESDYIKVSEGTDGTYVVRAQCKHCHKTFTVQGLTADDLSSKYNDYVSTLPATGYSKSGRLIWQPNWKFDSTDLKVWCPSNRTLRWDFLETYPNGIRDDFSETYIDGSLIIYNLPYQVCRTFYFGFASAHLRLPVTGYYKMLSTDKAIISFIASDDTVSDSIVSWSIREGNYSEGANFSLSDFQSSFTGHGGRVTIVAPVFEVVPVSQSLISTTYNINTRVNNFQGDYYDSVTNNYYNNTTIINETTNNYYDMTTNNYYTMSNWSYDYQSRTYFVTLEDGTTITVQFGDDCLTITNNNVENSYQYVINNNNTPSPNPETPSTCKHNWTETIDVAPTCLEGGHANFTCSLCGETYEQILSAKGHNWTVKEHVNTVYGESGVIVTQGHTLYECSACGEQWYTETATPPPDVSGGSNILAWLQEFKTWLGDKLDNLFQGDGDTNNFWNTNKKTFTDVLSSLLQTLLDFLTDILEKLLGLVKDLLSFLFDLLSSVVITGISDFFTGLKDSRLFDFVTKDDEGSAVALPEGVATVFAFFSGVILALPVELRSILLFGTALIVLIGVIKIIKS